MIDHEETGCCSREVVDAVAGRAELFLDRGVRTGDDIAKALALGARAVLIGRPSRRGLTAGGEGGVVDVLGILREEHMETLAQIGLP
jgi:isopentenyl diphosphate isomerase/L-lactate dehydrogenase-like FMN-dependent dehydrogenase